MGKAFTFQCKNCGHVLKFYFGIGAMYPEKYQEIINDALIGNLGKEIQKFLIENADGAIDISRVLANCENCGKHEMVRDLTMYLPEKNFVQEKNYPLPCEFEKNYKVFQKYEHKCSYCGEDVEIITEKNFSSKIKLQCPNCDSEMSPKKTSPKHWD
ncbi:MAG: hypothetical protein IK062_07255 [Selenomonadaceae bacterium]|nr:hypothetical protein [Selenomonadaceae bacterium]